MEYVVLDNLNKEQIEQLHILYKQEWWTKERVLADVERMVENSDVVIGICERKSNELIGFGRVITDYVYKAIVLDIIVKSSHRGMDLGRVLLDSIFKQPALQEVNHFELYCLPKMVPFYRKWGFTEQLGELQFMRLVKDQ